MNRRTFFSWVGISTAGVALGENVLQAFARLTRHGKTFPSALVEPSTSCYVDVYRQVSTSMLRALRETTPESQWQDVEAVVLNAFHRHRVARYPVVAEIPRPAKPGLLFALSEKESPPTPSTGIHFSIQVNDASTGYRTKTLIVT